MSIRYAIAAIIAAGVVEGQFGKSTGPEGWLADHNYFRCKHGSAPLKWDADLARRAQAVADGLARANSGLKHSGTYNSAPYAGENLASGSGNTTCNGVSGPYSQHCAVWAWYNEYNKYLTCDKVTSGAWTSVSGVGHWTAMTWKGINLLGCGSSGKYFVCHYGHDLCKSSKGSACTGSMPPHLPNFNSSKCKGTDCLDCVKPALEATCSKGDSSTPIATTTTRAPVPTSTPTSTPSAPSVPTAVPTGVPTLAPTAAPSVPSTGAYEFGSLTGPAGWLADHNYFRCRHGAVPLKWDSDLAKKAQAWAEQMNKSQKMYHSDTYNIQPYSGESIAWGKGSWTCGPNGGKKQSYGQACSVWVWYNEYNELLGASKTDGTGWQSVSGAGHFTAMMWKGINSLGCGVSGVYHACHYGHDLCKTSKGSECTGTSPPHLPNYNNKKCQPGVCLESYKENDYDAAKGTCSAGPSSNTTTTTTRVPTAVPDEVTAAPAETTATPTATVVPTMLPGTTPAPSTGGAEVNAYGKYDGAAGYLADHNYFRCRHGAVPLKWDADLARKSLAWANQLNKEQKMYHSDTYNIVPYSGENLAWGKGNTTCGPNGGTKQAYGQHCAVWRWYNEYNELLGAGKTDGTSWQNVSGAGHFTAMMWKGINLLGCAQSGVYHVCHYGHDLCKNSKSKDCTGSSPAHLPNYNKAKCSPGMCLESAKPEYEAQCSRGTWPRRLQAEEEFVQAATMVVVTTGEPPVAPVTLI